MTNSTKIDKGSEWRKWDLHVHTPFSIYQRFGTNDDVTWEKYIKDLEGLPDDFAVIGVNAVSYTHLTLPTNREV